MELRVYWTTSAQCPREWVTCAVDWGVGVAELPARRKCGIAWKIHANVATIAIAAAIATSVFHVPGRRRGGWDATRVGGVTMRWDIGCSSSNVSAWRRLSRSAAFTRRANGSTGGAV